MTKKVLLMIVSLFCVASLEGKLPLEEIFSNSGLQSGESSLPIRPLLDAYERSFTVLELSPKKADRCQKIASDYACAYVTLGKEEILSSLTKVPEIAEQLVILQTEPTSSRLEDLAKCEHFDMVFADSLPSDFVEMHLHRILKLGDFTLIQIPLSLKKWNFQILYDQLLEQTYTLLCIDANGVRSIAGPLSDYGEWLRMKKGCTQVLCVVHQPKKKLTRNYFRGPDEKEYFIESSFEEKVLLKTKRNTHWSPGINLCSYKMLGGVYPTNQQIQEGLMQTRYTDHPDLTPYNVILNGEEIILIDWDYNEWAQFDWDRGIGHDPERGLQWIFFLLEVDSPSLFRENVSNSELRKEFIGR
ncbi:MAG: hypothetical protein KR126chlam1_01341 [Chlamydiae bacterium]|nr:hypothetical protein [Chlamydiota bacterium]